MLERLLGLQDQNKAEMGHMVRQYL